jgi:hypothetical protein
MGQPISGYGRPGGGGVSLDHPTLTGVLRL